jgi:hypothetical protein
MKKEIKNIPDSVHARLKRKAKESNQSFQEILYYYTLERFLYRLSRSKYSQVFVLKGALMFFGWGLPLSRPTRDIDLQGYTSNSAENLVSIIREVCVQPVEADGMIYDPESVRSGIIMEKAEYQGIRASLKGILGKSVISFHIDISFSDEITPSAKSSNYPTILGELGMLPFPICGYPYETSIAEKFQTMVALGTLNSRMKDFYDILILSHQFEIDGQILVEAFIATFRARSTTLPNEIPRALTDAFVQEKQPDWIGFINRLPPFSGISSDLSQVIADLLNFLLLPMQAASKGEKFDRVWRYGEGWQ